MCNNKTGDYITNLNLSYAYTNELCWGTIGEETPVAFAIYSELERTFCKVSIAWQTKSDKDGQEKKCPE